MEWEILPEQAPDETKFDVRGKNYPKRKKNGWEFH